MLTKKVIDLSTDKDSCSYNLENKIKLYFLMVRLSITFVILAFHTVSSLMPITSRKTTE